VVEEGSARQPTEFTASVGLTDREGSDLGRFGTGFAFGFATHTATARDITRTPQPNSVEPWVFGFRYEATLFSQDWMHRLSILGGFEPRWDKFHLALVGTAGGGLSAQTSGGSNALSAGVLLGGSASLEWQILWQVAMSAGVQAQALITNSGTVGLYGFFLGPLVTY
jgi:hypothetical protein